MQHSWVFLDVLFPISIFVLILILFWTRPQEHNKRHFVAWSWGNFICLPTRGTCRGCLMKCVRTMAVPKIFPNCWYSAEFSCHRAVTCFRVIDTCLVCVCSHLSWNVGALCSFSLGKLGSAGNRKRGSRNLPNQLMNWRLKNHEGQNTHIKSRTRAEGVLFVWGWGKYHLII